MSEWKLCKIGDLCDTISDTYKRTDDMVILINTSDVLEGEVLNHETVPNENLKGQFKKTFKRNDILYSEIRPANKRFAFVDFDNTENYIASTKLMVLRPHKEVVLPRFLYNILKSQTIINELQHLAETRSGTFPQITFSSELAPMCIKVPDIETQQKIASVLSALDDKIELNNRINKNLEELAQAIFNDMFPDIATGTHTVGEYITLKRGKGLLSKNAVFGNIPVVAGGIKPATYHNIANTTAPVLTVSASGANAGYVNLWHIPVWSSDSSFIDSTMTENVYFWYVMLKKRQKEIFDSQTGSAQPHIYPQHIEILPVFELDKKYILEFNDIVKPLFNRIGENKQENKFLSALRDALLPKLMNGEIDVSKVHI